jgi:hypothetical protein
MGEINAYLTVRRMHAAFSGEESIGLYVVIIRSFDFAQVTIPETTADAEVGAAL